MVKDNEFSEDNVNQAKSDYIELKELIDFFLKKWNQNNNFCIYRIKLRHF